MQLANLRRGEQIRIGVMERRSREYIMFRISGGSDIRVNFEAGMAEGSEELAFMLPVYSSRITLLVDSVLLRCVSIAKTASAVECRVGNIPSQG